MARAAAKPWNLEETVDGKEDDFSQERGEYARIIDFGVILFCEGLFIHDLDNLLEL